MLTQSDAVFLLLLLAYGSLSATLGATLYSMFPNVFNRMFP